MNKLAFVYSNKMFYTQINYVLSIIKQNYEIHIDIYYEEDFKSSQYDFVVYYGSETVKEYANLVILSSDLFSDKYLKLSSIPIEIDYYNDIPILFKDKSYTEHIWNSEGKLLINIDIIQSIFFLLTCYEEFVLRKYDRFGRFSAFDSVIYKNNLHCRPLVNEYIEFFISNLQECNIKIEKKNTWQEKEFAVMLSHDVDCINKYIPFFNELRLLASIFLVDKKPQEIPKRIIGYIKTKILKIEKDPYNTFEYINDLEKQLGYTSSFYFMTDKSGFYSINQKEVLEIIEHIVHNGSEVGLHPGLGTFDNLDKFSDQYNEIKEALNYKMSLGVRQHYLAFDSSKTWQIQEKCNVLYDSTVCFPQAAGFKVGYCKPYKPYDLKSNRTMNLWEIPLIVMEGSLFEYMNLDFEEAKDYMLKLFDKIVKYNGVYVVLWHNSALVPEYNIFSKNLMLWFYNYVKDFKCLVASGRNVLLSYLEGIKEE